MLARAQPWLARNTPDSAGATPEVQCDNDQLAFLAIAARVGYRLRMTELPVALENGLIYFTDDMAVGDVMILRPGAWHAFEDCHDLQVINCCFDVELLRRELAWTREDPLLSQLLWDGPYAPGQAGMLASHLDQTVLAGCVVHLDALESLRTAPLSQHRADIIGRLSLILGHLARGADQARGRLSGVQEPTHPAVIRAIRLLEAQVAHDWTLAELAEQLHLAPNYLGRLFKSATGLPPMAYLAHYRMETAAVLLGRTDRSVAQVGEAVGCTDQNYFARRFKAHYGLSPSTYRFRGTSRPVAAGDAA